MHSPLRLVIVGGVAAGASAAARARRLSESASLTLVERGPDVSFANCGLPYFIGGEIAQRDALAVQTPATLKALLALDVRTSTEAVALDRAGKRVPLGGPANRQGRLAADHIFRPAGTKPYAGSLGTAIVRVFEVAAGLTGWTEKRLRAAGRAYRTVTVNDNHHAGYFPGAKPILLKLTWDPGSGRVLGAQATGLAGVDKRLDVLATAIAGGLTIDDLAQLELAYAPPFGAAKDIVNLAGFTACNTRDGLVTPVDALPDDPAVQVLDVRPPALVKSHPLPRTGAKNIPLGALRARLGELDRSRPVVTICALGKTAYFAARILAQDGFQVSALTGGIRAQFDPRSPAKLPTP